MTSHIADLKPNLTAEIDQNFEQEREFLIEDLDFTLNYLKKKFNKAPAKLDPHHVDEIVKVSEALREFAFKYKDHPSLPFDLTRLLKDIAHK